MVINMPDTCQSIFLAQVAGQNFDFASYAIFFLGYQVFPAFNVMIFLNPGRNIIYYRPKCGQVGFSGPLGLHFSRIAPLNNNFFALFVTESGQVQQHLLSVEIIRDVRPLSASFLRLKEDNHQFRHFAAVRFFCEWCIGLCGPKTRKFRKSGF